MTQMTPIELSMAIAELRDTITNAHPKMATLLRDIHTLLKSDPDLVTVLTEEEISVIVSGLEKHTLVEITTAALKAKKSLKSTTVADL